MNSDEIEFVLRNRCGAQFLGVFASNQLPAKLPAERPLLMVCNTDASNKEGQHWICIRIDAVGEFFNSLSGPVPAVFKSYLNKHCKTWITNDKQLQSAVSYYCGHYCIFYCLYRSIDYSLKDILDCFSGDTGLNDYMAHTFVCRGIGMM
jgi:hypothetical protein